MNITEKIRNLMTEALRQKNKEDREFYAYVLGELEAARKAKQSVANPSPVLSEEEEIGVMRALYNKTKKAISETKDKTGSITDSEKLDELQKFFDKKEKEAAFYAGFLPKQMTSDEINHIIAEVFCNLPEDVKLKVNKGILMKHVMPAVRGKADGKLVQELVDNFMNSK